MMNINDCDLLSKDEAYIYNCRSVNNILPPSYNK